MLTQPFLTELDSRAAVKGSVDPLGLQAVWTHLGRAVVGNLTTVTTSARDFTVLLTGYWLSERCAENGSAEDALQVHLRWEQLAGYSRAQRLSERGFRGSRRVLRRLAEGRRVTISADSDHQILASQRMYGVFGLYKVPAKASGLIDDETGRLDPIASDIIGKRMGALLERVRGRRGGILRLLEAKSTEVELGGRDEEVAKAVADALKATGDPTVKDLYRRHLLFGGPDDPTAGRQRELAHCLAPFFKDEEFRFEPAALTHLIRTADERGWHELAQRLEDIRVTEAAMAPFAAAFGFVVQRDGATVEDVAAELDGAWGSSAGLVEPEALEARQVDLATAVGDASTAGRLVQTARALRKGEYAGAVRLLLEQNASVMHLRGGTPWVEERKGKLRVRLRYDSGRLPARDELPGLWKHAYFLDAVRQIGAAVGVA